MKRFLLHRGLVPYFNKYELQRINAKQTRISVSRMEDYCRVNDFFNQDVSSDFNEQTTVVRELKYWPVNY